MSGALGLSVEEMNQLVTRFQTAAGELSSARGNVTQHLGATFWNGPDGDATRNRWDSEMAPRVVALETRLADLVRQLRVQIDQQVDASRVDTVYAGSLLVSREGGGLAYSPPRKKKKPWWKRGFIGDFIGGVGEVLSFGADVLKTTVRTIMSNPLSVIGAISNPVAFLASMAASTLMQNLGVTGIAGALLSTGLGIVSGALSNASSLGGFANQVVREVTTAVPKVLTTEALAEIGVPRGVTSFVMAAAESPNVRFNWDEISYKGGIGEVMGIPLGGIDVHVSPSGLLDEWLGGGSPPGTPLTGEFGYSEISASGGDINAGFAMYASPEADLHAVTDALLTEGAKALKEGVSDVSKSLGVDPAPALKTAAVITERVEEAAHDVVERIDAFFLSRSER